MADRGARVFAFDRDPDAIREGQALAEEKGVTLIDGEFSRMEQLLAERGVTSVSGVTLAIGVSSMQLDRPARGFSFQGDGPPDLTISRSGMSAANFLKHAPEQEITHTLSRFGTEPRPRRRAEASL